MNINSEIITNGQASPYGPTGILKAQSMFSDGGMFDARSSFVRFLNNVIFSQIPIAINRPEAVSRLSAKTPIDPYLIWHRPLGVEHIEPIPPSTEWDYQVYSIEERDRLLLDPTLAANILSSHFFRVLVNGLGNQDAPQWCVYDTNLPVSNVTVDANFISYNPNQVYTIAKSYDQHVTTIDAMNNLTNIVIGNRILVDGNPSTSNFWTIYKYTGGNNFVLTRYQTYNTDDFYSLTDWYAKGYSVSNPPVVVYPTIAARNIGEGFKPQTLFVKVLDDGHGDHNFIWTIYINGSWKIVAQQNGTIQFSSKFYTNSNAPVIGLDPILQSDLANIPVRDGSWEFRYLFDALRDFSLLEDLEVNQAFFSILHFIHAQQDQVPWAFKTSFMNVAGYNEPLLQTPIQPIDISSSLVNYIEEVKPYRVKIRTFTTIYTPPIDYANALVSDFDNPPYYDNNIGSYRPLLLSDPNDLVIYQTTQPWKSWYNSYSNSGTDPNNYDGNTWNPVRHFNIKMLYDRVDHMPVIYTQEFLYGNSLNFILDTPNIDLTQSIVEVFVNDNKIISSGYTIISSDTFSLNTIPIIVPGFQTWIKLVVRNNLTTGLEADRIEKFYTPVNPDNPEKNLRRLMDMEFKQNVFDGGNFANGATDLQPTSSQGAFLETINPNTQYYHLSDPSINPNRPPELIVGSITESLSIILFDVNSTVTGTSISTARPGSDLLAPVEVGDFDAQPLDTLDYDFGETPSGTYVVRGDAWEVTPWGVIGGTLGNAMDSYSNTVTITIANAGIMPFTLPSTELLNLSNNTANTTTIRNKPGVVWINGERISFFDYSLVANTVILKQITRGTHNTRICVQHNLQASYTGDGVSNSFVLPNTDISNIVVTVNGILTYSNGVVITNTAYNTTIPKTINIDYTSSSINGNAVITFFTPPLLNTNVYITKSLDLTHPVGSQVLNGAWNYQDQNYYTLVGNSVSNTVSLGK